MLWSIQGEDVVRQSGVPYAVVRPCALTEEPAGAELVISQGDDIKVPPLHLPVTRSHLESMRLTWCYLATLCRQCQAFDCTEGAGSFHPVWDWHTALKCVYSHVH